jgi:hypothetical protein
MLGQHIKDAGQMRTPPPLTPQDVQSRVLRICNEYDKIQEANKNKVKDVLEKINSRFFVNHLSFVRLFEDLS